MAISTGKVVALIQAMGGGADPAVIEAKVQDWLDAHPEATTTVQDGSITEQKLATSIAQKLGLISSLSDEIVDLKSAFDSSLVDGTLSGWEKGSFNTTNGTNYSDNTRIRNQTKVGYSTGVCRFKLAPGYSALMFAWDLNGDYVGAYKTDGTWTNEASGWKSVTEFDLSTVPNYLIKLSIARVPSSSDIEASEESNCVIQYYTDKTLSIENKSADAKAVGNALISLNKIVQYDNSELISGEYILISVGNVGNIGTNSAYSRTDYLPVTPGMTVEMYEDWAGDTVGACWYNIDKTPFATGIANAGTAGAKVTLTVPENAYYIRTSVQNSHISWYPFLIRIIPSWSQIAENVIDLQNQIDSNSDLYLPKTIYHEVYNDTNLVTGYENGYINDSGELKTSGDYKHSKYIDLSGSTNGKIYLNAGFVYWQYYAFYNESKTYLGGKDQYAIPVVSNGIATWTIPPNAKYLIISYSSTAQAQASWASYTGAEPTGKVIRATVEGYMNYSDYPSNPCDYNGTEISLFHKGICIGDSLTAGVCNYKVNGSDAINTAFPNYAYPAYLTKITGVEVTNAGIGGLTTAQWYTTYLANHADWSGYDFAIIQLGVNDALYNNGWTQEEETALTNIIAKLKSDNQRIKIFVATIIPATAYGGTAFDDISANLRTFVSGMSDSDVVLVDLAEYGHTGESIAYNAGHLTGAGYLRLAMDYKAYISMIIRDNPIDYRFMQFAGTDYSY